MIKRIGWLSQNKLDRKWIWGSHGNEYEDSCLLGCSTVQSESQGDHLTMKVASSPKTMINTYHTTWCYIPEDNHINREQSRKIFRKTELIYQYFRDIKKILLQKKTTPWKNK
jgi:hypothetical protein